MPKKQIKELSPEERLEQATVPEEEQPYPLPEGWKWVRLSDVTEIIMGQSPAGTDTSNNPNDIPLIGGASDMGDLYPKPQKYTRKPTKITRNGDLILCIRATLGRPIFANGQYCLGRGVAGIHISDHIISGRYLRYFLISNENYLYKNATGSTFLQVTGKVLQLMLVPMPPLSIQNKIADYLDKEFARLDKAKEQVQEVIDSSEQRKQSILHKAFTGELTEKWRKENEISLNSWQKRKLADVCKINPKKEDVSGLPDDIDVSFFPMASLDETIGAITDPQIKPLKEVRKGFTNFKEGDVVFAKITPCMENGKSAVIGELVNHIGYGTTEFYVLRCGKEIDKYFLFHLIRSQKFRDEAKHEMTGAVGQQRVPKKYLENYELNIPSIDEQRIIVNLLNNFISLEKEISDGSEQMIAQLDDCKKSILSKAFRGKLNL